MENAKPIDYSIAKPVEECQKRAELCSVPPPSQRNAKETCFGLPQQPTYYNNLYVQNPMTSYTSAALRAYLDKNVFYALPQIEANWSFFPRSDTPPVDASALHKYSTTWSHLQPLNTFKSMLLGQGDEPQPPQSPSVWSLRRRPTCKCPNCADIHRLRTATMYLRNYNHNCHIPGCCKDFGKTSVLKAHLRCHTFFCNWSFCGKWFKRWADLERHLRTHTGEKSFACKICSKRFTRSDNLSQHAKSHTREKQFTGNICSKCFTTSDNLSTHEKTHIGEKQFTCKICSKRFTKSDNLSKHEKTHTSEKRFACKICNKRFTKSDYLSKHEKTHSGEKPFACKICSKRFTRSDNLSEHEKTHIALEDRRKAGSS